MQIANNLQAIIASAKDCISSGNFNRARSLLQGASKVLPNNSEINRLLGVIEAISGDNIKALEFFNKAIKFGPKNSNAHSNRGNVRRAMGDAKAALNDYTEAIKLDPKNSEAFYSRALMYEALLGVGNAIEDYSKAISINPDYIDAYLNLATLMIREGRLHEALNCLKILSERNPYIFSVWLNMGYIFNSLNDFSLALDCYDKALSLSPNDPRAWSNKGTTLDAMGLLSEAMEHYLAAIRLDPSDPAPHSNLGYVLHRQKKYKEALIYFETSLNLDQDFADAWCNKGMTFMELRQFEEARKAFTRAIQCNPQHASAHLNLGHLLLGLFEFQTGWEEYEWRWKSSNNDSASFISSKPIWRGQKNIQSILIWSEQGVGDQILYATLLPEVSNYAQSITVSTDKKLIPVLQQAYKNITFIDKKIPLSGEEFEYQIPIASLPKLLRPNLESFLSVNKSHLRCGEDHLQNVKQFVSEKIDPTKKKCGLSWFSGNQRLGSDKSIPVDELAPILSLAEYEFIDLQYGETKESRQIALNKMGATIHKFEQINNDDNLDGLLALICTCDVVVTVSNTTAHLAAALGKETLLLLPYSAGKFWYWNSYQGKNLWYDNVIALEQKKQGDWGGVILRARDHMLTLGGGEL